MLQELNFIMLHVSDVEKAIPFYTEKLGLVIEDRQGSFVQFKQPQGTGAILALVQEGDGEPIQNIELWWLVDDADTTFAELSAKGVEIAQGLQDEPFGRTFTILDPFGNKLSMMKLSSHQ